MDQLGHSHTEGCGCCSNWCGYHILDLLGAGYSSASSFGKDDEWFDASKRIVTYEKKELEKGSWVNRLPFSFFVPSFYFLKTIKPSAMKFGINHERWRQNRNGYCCSIDSDILHLLFCYSQAKRTRTYMGSWTLWIRSRTDERLILIEFSRQNFYS